MKYREKRKKILIEFFITSVAIADSEKGEVPEAKGLDFEVETLYEEETPEVGIKEDATNSEKYSLFDVKGIGDGTAKNLVKNGIASVEDLLESDPETLVTKISGISSFSFLK